MAQNRVSIGIDLDISSIQSQSQQLQGILGKMNLTSTMKQQFDNLFSSLGSNLTKYQTAFSKGFSSKSDVSNFEKLGKAITTDSDAIDKMFSKLRDSIGSMSSDQLANMFKLDAKDISAIEQIEGQINSLKDQINSLNTSNLDKLKLALDPSNFASSKGKSLVAELTNDIENGKLDEAGQKLNEFIQRQQNALKSLQSNADNNGLTPQLKKTITTINGNITAAENLQQAFNDVATGAQPIQQQIDSLNEQKLSIIAENAERGAQSFNTAADSAHNVSQATQQIVTETNKAAQAQGDFASQVDQLGSRVKYFFSLTNSVMLFRRALQKAIDTVKDLDAVMTEAAVVTDYNVGDMWSQLPEYAARATKLGVSIHDAYESATLYYQQGLKTNQVVAVSNSTLKMARIAGLDAADATDRMTNALRGFKMAINEESAEHIADVYSNLAAHTASNVDEISTAMTKTASLAANANMSFENTAAFLSQIIETTRESAETAGTALKTVIARFSEVKSLYSEGQLMGTDSEGEEINVNKVSQALRTAGINMNEFLTGAKGLDEIFIELASKWDSLTTVQQRYIATTAAGSRQQSRFIALMSDYDRTVELTNMANNSAGASNQQYEKTLDSLESKLNQLQNAWNQFLMGIANSDIIKFGIDVLTGLITAINKITDGLPGVASGFAKIGVAILALKGGSAIFNALIAGFKAAGTTSGITFGKAFRTSLTASLSKVSKVTNLFKFDVKKFEIPKNVTSSLNTYTDSMRKSQIAQKALRGEVEGYTITEQRKTALLNAITKADAKAAFATQEYAQAMGLTNAQANLAIAMDGKLLTSQQILGLSQSKLSNEKKEEVLAYLASNGVKLTGVSINKMATASIITEAEAQELSNLVQKKGIPALIANVKAKLELTAANSSGVVAQIANWLATKMQTDANWKLWLSLGVILVAIIAIIAVVIIIIALITLVIKGIKAFIKNIKDSTPENKVKALQERYKELSEAQDAVNSKLDELNSKHDELEDMNKKFEELAEGTNEWKKNLIETNAAVLNLISTYPELNKYLEKGEYGQLQISEAGWDAIIEEQLTVSEANQIAMINTQQKINSAKNQVNWEKQQYTQGTSKGKKIFGDTSRDAWDWAAEMGESFAGPFNMITDLATEDWDESKINWKKIIPNTLLPGDIVAGLVRGLAETDEDREKIATGGLTQDQYYDFAAAVAEAGITVSQATTDDWAKIEAIFNAKYNGLDLDFSQIQEKMKRLGADFDLLASEAEATALANEALEESIQRTILDNLGIDKNTDEYDMLLEIGSDKIGTDGAKGAEEEIDQIAKDIEAKYNDSDETNESLRKAYAASQDYYYNEDDKKIYKSEGSDEEINISEESMARAMASKEYNQKQEEFLQKALSVLQLIPTEQKKSNEKYRQLQGILSKDGKKFSQEALNTLVSNLGTEFTDADLTNYFSELGANLEGLDLDFSILRENIILASNAFEQIYAESEKLGIQDEVKLIITSINSNLNKDLNYDQTKGIVEILNEANKRGASVDDLNYIGEAINTILTNTPEDDIDKILNEILGTNFGDTMQIESTINTLNSKFKYLSNILDHDFERSLISAAKSIYTFSEEFSQNLKDTNIAARDIYDKMKSENRYTLSADDKKILTDAGISEDLFTPYGATGAEDEYMYLGDIDTILTTISARVKDIYDIMPKKSKDTTDNKPAETDEDRLIKALKDAKEKRNNTKDQLENAEGKITKSKDAVSNFINTGSPIFGNNLVIEPNSTHGYIDENGVFQPFPQITIYPESQNKENINGLNIPTITNVSVNPQQNNEENLNDIIDVATAESNRKQAYEEHESAKIDYDKAYNDLKQYYLSLIGNVASLDILDKVATNLDTSGLDQSTIEELQQKIDDRRIALIRGAGANEQYEFLNDQYSLLPEGVEQYTTSLASLAIVETKTQKAIEATSDSISKSIKTLNEAKKGSVEYSNALSTLANGLDTIFEVSDNILDSNQMKSFVVTHLSLIQEWAGGNMEAGEEIAKSYAAIAMSSIESQLTQEQTIELMEQTNEQSLATLLDDVSIALSGIEEGSTIAAENLTGSMATFIQGLEFLLSSEIMSIDQANQIMQAAGMEAVISQTEDGWSIDYITKKSFTGAYNGFGGYKSGDKSNSNNKNKYENKYDPLYNLVADIEEQQRIEKDYNTKRQDIEKNPTTIGNDLLSNISKQLDTYYSEAVNERAMLAGRQEQAKQLMQENADLQKYAIYNKEDNTVEIDWDAINQITNDDEGKRIDDYISQLENAQKEITTANERLYQIEQEVEQLKTYGRDEYIDLEQQIYDAIVAERQKEIDELEKVNESINDANDKLISSIQDNLSKIRQDRDNQKQEEEIEDTASQLAYLSQDTSGRNQLEIMQLQEQLEEQRQSYTDALIDQKISELQEQNADAAAQREQQIDLMQSQLNYDEQNGVYWTQTHEMMKKMYDEKGGIKMNSEAVQLLKDNKDWAAMSEEQKKKWGNELSANAIKAYTYMNQEKFSGKIGGIQDITTNTKTDIADIKQSIAEIKTKDWKIEVNVSDSSDGFQDKYNSEVSGIKWFNGLWPEIISRGTNDYFSKARAGSAKVYSEDENYYYIEASDGSKAKLLKEKVNHNGVYAFATGGLADFTGPAWLDGTKSKPELVLNAKDTQNFIQLRDVLAEVMGSNYQVTTQDKDGVKGGDNYFTIDISVDKLENDYDVEALAEQIKRMINDDAMYRNVNVINLLR